jgi:hypothetical protein
VTIFNYIFTLSVARGSDRAKYALGCSVVHSPALPESRSTLGKGYFTLGKVFAECNTRQITLDKYFIGKVFFAECFLTLGKLRIKKIKKNSKTFF